MHKVLVVCMANYCRSPVAEHYLRKRFHGSLDIDSAGLIDFHNPGMDKRSIEFIKEDNEAIEIHQPKKINEKLISSSDIVYAIDFKILMNLNSIFKKHRDKFKIFGLESKKIILNDPYHFNDDDYFKVMRGIKYISENISIKI